MARRKAESPQKTAMREMIHDYLKKNDINIKNEADVNDDERQDAHPRRGRYPHCLCGRVIVRSGVRFIPSWKSILKND